MVGQIPTTKVGLEMSELVTIISENVGFVNRISEYWPGKTRRISNWSDFEDCFRRQLDDRIRVALLDLQVQALNSYISFIREAQDVWPFLISVLIWSTKEDIKRLEHTELLSLSIDRLVEKPRKKVEYLEFIEFLKPFFAEDQHKRIKIADYNPSEESIHGEFLTGEKFVVPATDIRNPWPKVKMRFPEIRASSDRYCLTIPTSDKKKTVDLPWDYIRSHYLPNRGGLADPKKQLADTQKTVGKRIRALRDEAGFSQEQLAKKSGLARATVNRIETGKTLPSLATLRKFAKVFGLPVTEILPS